MILGFDFDNTIICYDNLFYRCALDHGWISEKESPKKNDIRNAVRKLQDGENKWRQLQLEVYGKRISKAVVKPFFKDFLSWCNHNKIIAHIVSHKMEFAAADAAHAYPLRELSLSWMKDNGVVGTPDSLKESAVFFTSTRKEKSRKIAELKCDIFIDDLLEVFEDEEFPDNVEKILFTDDLEETAGIKRCSNWKAIQNLIANSEHFLRHICGQRYGNNMTLERIVGGRNNRGYKLKNIGTNPLFVKHYMTNAADNRDRGGVEFSAYRLLHKHGIKSVPKPVYLEDKHVVGIYEWIEGIRPASVNPDKFQQFITFIGQLSGIKIPYDAFPEASDACFSPLSLIKSIKARRGRLSEISNTALNDFLKRCDKFLDMTIEDLPSADSSVEIPIAERCLSPSDFGLHNSLINEEGVLHFIDFEYFGWDDPAKMISDFLLHPGMELPIACKQTLYAAAGEIFSKDCQKRIRETINLHGLKWCLIMLNEFLRNESDRRIFASNSEDFNSVCEKQLAKSEMMLHSLIVGDIKKCF